MRKILFLLTVLFVGFFIGCTTTTNISPAGKLIITVDKLPKEIVGEWKVIVGSTDGGRTNGAPDRETIIVLKDTAVTVNGDKSLVETLILFNSNINQYKISFSDSEEWIIGIDGDSLFIFVYAQGQEQLRMLLQKNGTKSILPNVFPDKKHPIGEVA